MATGLEPTGSVPDWKPDVDSTHIGDEQVMATSAQVQQLYIALLGRAADKPGLDWWLENINGGERTLEQAAAAFTTSEEYVATYGSLQGAELVGAVYANLFERNPSAEEVAYWVNDGRPADQLLAAFLTYASPADQTVINNKVTVAQYYTEAAGDDYDLDDAAAIIADVDGSATSVGDALENLPVSSATLTAALGQWEAANEAKDTFLAGLDLDDDATTPTTESQVEALITTAAGTPVAAFNNSTYASATLSATSTAAQQNAAFVAARASHEVAVVAQQGEVTDAQNAVNALNDARDVNAYIAAVNAETQAEQALNPAAAAAAGAIADFGARTANSALTVDKADYDVDATDPAAPKAVLVSTDLTGLAKVATLNAQGVLVAANGVTETTNPGITSLLAAINADIAAQVAYSKAEAATDAAASATNSGLVDTLIQEQADLATLQEGSAALEELISDVKEAYSLNAQLENLNEAIGNAFDAIDAGTTLTANVLGTTDTVADNVTPGADLFIFNGESAVIGTGFAADDRLFIGSDYSLVVLEAGQTVGTTALGSANALEVFWDAANSTLYVEQEAFSGNAKGLANFETIVLTGVTDDVALSGGFVQLA